jgi:hypothetical protein
MKPFIILAILALSCTARAIHIDGVVLNPGPDNPSAYVEVFFSHSSVEGRDEADTQGNRPGDANFSPEFNATAETSGRFSYVGTWGFQALLITWVEFDNLTGEILETGLRYEGLSQEESDALLEEFPLLTHHSLSYDPVTQTGVMRWANSPSGGEPVPELTAPLSLLAFGFIAVRTWRTR